MQLNPQTQIIDAVLTERGRELLATGDPNFQVVYFAVGDDEVSGRGENTRQANMTSNKGSSKYLRIRVIIAVRIVHCFLFNRILRNICASSSSWYNERVL